MKTRVKGVFVKYVFLLRGVFMMARAVARTRRA